MIGDVSPAVLARLDSAHAHSHHFVTLYRRGHARGVIVCLHCGDTRRNTRRQRRRT